MGWKQSAPMGRFNLRTLKVRAAGWQLALAALRAVVTCPTRGEVWPGATLLFCPKIRAVV